MKIKCHSVLFLLLKVVDPYLYFSPKLACEQAFDRVAHFPFLAIFFPKQRVCSQAIRSVPRTLKLEDTLKIGQRIFSYVSVSKIKIDNYLKD